MDGAQECSQPFNNGGFNEAFNYQSVVQPSENPERGAVPGILGLYLFKPPEEQKRENFELDHSRQA